jgi:6-phosphogluconolactonase (cycloisomerase 2 family)
LVVANYATGSVVTIGIEEDGRLIGVQNLIELPGQPGPHRQQQKGSHPHQLAVHPVGGWIAVPDKGCDAIHAVALDEASGRLSHLAKTSVAPASGPRHLVFSKDGRYAWIVLELTSQVLATRVTVDGEFHAFQRLSTVPASETSETTGSGILLDPTGRALFISNRGHGSVVRFALDPSTGELSSPIWHDAGGRVPRFITFSPDGDVLVANEDADTIVRLSPRTGIPPVILTYTGSPVCIVFQE